MAEKTVTNKYYDIILIGKTGQGKSTTGNKLLDIVRKECSLADFTPIEDKTFPFFIVKKGADLYTRYCKVITNPERKVRVLDSPGFYNKRQLNKQTLSNYESNLEIVRDILHTQMEHKMVFARILYFLPSRGPLETADATFHAEIEVLHGFFGREIFNIMVIIATNHDTSRHQGVGFNEDDRKKTEDVFMTAVRTVTKFKIEKCPPILYLSVDEKNVLERVEKAKVLDNTPLSLSTLVRDRCSKCAKKLSYVNIRGQRVIVRVTEDEGLPTEKEIPVDDSLCHPYFVKPAWYKSEKCAHCGQSPGSKGCTLNKTIFPKNTTKESREIEVLHSTTMH